MMHFKKTKRKHFDNQRTIQEIEAIVNDIGGEVTIHENPVSFPVKDAKVGYDFQGGLIDVKTLQLIKEAVLIRNNKISQEMPEWDFSSNKITTLPEIDGIYIYGGILFNNFGHFLLESISRLWAYDLFKRFDPYILFYAPWGIPDYKNKNNYMYQLFKAFGIPIKRIVFITEIVQLKRIITPDSRFINFIKTADLPDRLHKAGRYADKIYVSRSKLPFNTGRPLGEAEFEKYLQTNDYLVIHPEKLSLYEQIAIYGKAKKIIFCDGGAIYATVLLPHLSADVAIVARRRDYRGNYKELTEHFYGYKKTVLWIDEVIGQYQYGLETWDAAAEIDWQKVSITLKEEGFTKTTFEALHTPAYDDIKRTELQQYIQSIQWNPLFLNYMQKLKENYPVLPGSF
jgi:hypothetical protein